MKRKRGWLLLHKYENSLYPFANNKLQREIEERVREKERKRELNVRACEKKRKRIKKNARFSRATFNYTKSPRSCLSLSICMYVWCVWVCVCVCPWERENHKLLYMYTIILIVAVSLSKVVADLCNFKLLTQERKKMREET